MTIECPSKAWDRYESAQEAQYQTDDDLLEALDAYEHLTWTVGFDSEEYGDWLACFDFKVFDHPDRGVLVAYHVVVNSDSGGFTDTVESCVVGADKAPTDLPNYWTDIAVEHGGMSESDLNDASKINANWNEALALAINQHQSKE